MNLLKSNCCFCAFCWISFFLSSILSFCVLIFASIDAFSSLILFSVSFELLDAEFPLFLTLTFTLPLSDWIFISSGLSELYVFTCPFASIRILVLTFEEDWPYISCPPVLFCISTLFVEFAPLLEIFTFVFTSAKDFEKRKRIINGISRKTNLFTFCIISQL